MIVGPEALVLAVGDLDQIVEVLLKVAVVEGVSATIAVALGRIMVGLVTVAVDLGEVGREEVLVVLVVGKTLGREKMKG